MSDGAILWFARIRHVERMGPFQTELRAHRSTKGPDGSPVPEAHVWCETEEEYAEYLKKTLDLRKFIFPSGGGLLGATARSIAFAQYSKEQEELKERMNTRLKANARRRKKK